MLVFEPSDLNAIGYGKTKIDIVSFGQGDAGDSLLDVVEYDPGKRTFAFLSLPVGHSALKLVDADPEPFVIRVAEVVLAGVIDTQIVSVGLPSAGEQAFALRGYDALGDFDEFLARQRDSLRWSQTGVWALLHTRAHGFDGGDEHELEIGPATRVFPTARRQLVIEPLELRSGERQRRQGSIAIHDMLAREHGVHRVVLRLQIDERDRLASGVLKTATVVHVMNQRRFLRRWINDKRRQGDTIIEPLTIEGIRRALGVTGDRIPAVEDGGDFIAYSLAELIKPQAGEFDGIEVTAGRGIWEIEFVGATLADYVGVCCWHADNGEIVVEPENDVQSGPAWLFRVDLDGLIPVDISAEAPEKFGEPQSLTKRIQNRAALLSSDSGDARGVASRALDRQTEFLVQTLGNRSGAAQLDIAPNRDLFWPMRVTAFAEICPPGLDAESVRAIYARFRDDAPAARFMSSRPHLTEKAQGIATPRPGDRAEPEPANGLPRRIARRAGMPDLVADDLELQGQIEAMRMLAAPSRVTSFSKARITFDKTAAHIGGADPSVFESIANESFLEEIAESLQDNDRPADADIVRAHVSRRRAGKWTTWGAAENVVKLVRDVEARRVSALRSWSLGAEAPRGEAPTTKDRRSREQLAEEIQKAFAQAALRSAPPAGLADARSAFNKLIAGYHDPFMLRQFESRLAEILNPPRNLETFEALIDICEGWAGLGGYVQRVTATGAGKEGKPRSRSDAVGAFLARVYRDGMTPAIGEVSDFDKRRARLAKAIGECFDIRGTAGEAETLARNAREYADLMFFQRAHDVLAAVAEATSKDPASAREAYELSQLQAAWPRQAARAWDAALRANGSALLKIWDARNHAAGGELADLAANAAKSRNNVAAE